MGDILKNKYTPILFSSNINIYYNQFIRKRNLKFFQLKDILDISN